MNNYYQLKFLQIGLGSMGKRRIRNLLSLGIPLSNIRGFDVSKDRRDEAEKLYGIRTYQSFNQANSSFKLDVLIISTPPDAHSQYFLAAARQNKHFFVEVSTTTSGYKELIKLIQKRTIVAAPSCTFRFFKPIIIMRNLLARGTLGRVYTFNHHLGQYLPDWHPWEDYRSVYFSRQSTSAINEMIPYELSWLQYIFNERVIRVKGIKRKLSKLEMNADDTAVALIGFKNEIWGTLLIEVLSRSPFRRLHIVAEKGSIIWDWLAKTIRVFRIGKGWKTIKVFQGRKEPGYLAEETMYQAEMRAFLAAISRSKPYPYTFTEDYRNLVLLKRFNL